MTLRGGRKPRNGSVGGGDDQARRRVVDQGWNDYRPPEPGETVDEGRRERDLQRSYRTGRFHGPGPILRFAILALVVGGLVTAGLYFVARPLVINGIVDWAAENPTALSLPFVSDLVRTELGDSITKPVDASDKTSIAITISVGETPKEIADQLVTAGVIRDARAFVFEAIQTDMTGNFQAGRHNVSKSQTIDQMLTSLTTPPVAPPLVRLTFREGLRIEQMVALMELKEAKPDDPRAVLKMNVATFYDLVMHPPADLVAGYPWLKLPPGGSLEGFLFPATYQVAPDIQPMQLVQMLLDAFVSNAPDGFLDLPPDQIYQKVQIASLVETEAKVDSDRALIAGVYTNRLNPKMWPTGLLDADPTLNYANDSVWLQSNDISTWVNYSFWNPIQAIGPLSQVVFPGSLAAFNTYHHAGLPPNPICSPSAASLAAAMKPDTTDGYLYFLAKNDGTGTHAFAKTAAEQQANLKKYGYIK
jgi:UPF0755 protein